jgi:hypothetical protein
MEKAFTINCIAPDETVWAIYFMTETKEQAEQIVEKLNLNTDENGVFELTEILSHIHH